MGRGACQLGRTAGVEIGEKESRRSVSGGGKWKWDWERLIIGTGAMCELRKGFRAVDVVREVQSN